MSVFTSVSIPQLQEWLQDYAIGDLIELKGISSGITNTNYFVITQQDRYVLTLFEHNTLEELPYFIDLMRHLAEHGIPCPKPIANKAGESLHLLNGKPAVLVSCLTGRDVTIPSVDQCRAVGRVLAQMHIAGLSFKPGASHNHNPRGAEWRKVTAQQVLPHLSMEDQALLKDALEIQSAWDITHLPMGVIHADLFRDNVLFDGNRVGGVIDFYYACYGVWAYDLAIVVNDWCVQADGAFDLTRRDALLAAYEEVRPMTPAERHIWAGLLQMAALRFWLSRLYDKIYPSEGELTHAKDPDHFRNILKLRMSMR